MGEKHLPKLIAYEYIDLNEDDTGYLVHTNNLFALNIVRFPVLTNKLSFSEKLILVFLSKATPAQKLTNSEYGDLYLQVAEVLDNSKLAISLLTIASRWERHEMNQIYETHLSQPPQLVSKLLAVKYLGSQSPIVYDKNGKNIIDSLSEHEHDLVCRMNKSGVLIPLDSLVRQINKRS